MTRRRHADRLPRVRLAIGSLLGTLAITVAPGVAAAQTPLTRLVISITSYCSRRESDIIAGLGSRALLLSAAAAFSLQTPVGTQLPR